MFSPFYVSLLYFYYFTSPIASESLAPYNPVENIALDCGSSGNNTGQGHRPWLGDSTNSKLHNLAFSIISEALKPPTQVDRVPYITARLSRSEFTYVFPVTSGQKFIRLHFYPASYTKFDRSKAFFSVKLGQFTLLRNFSAALTADALHQEGFSKEFCVNVGDEKALNITFTPSPDSYAFINGIEVVSMPPNLYYTAAGTSGADLIGVEQQYTIENYTALETDYRVNIGGRGISPAYDTGMWRSWLSEYSYLVVAGDSVLPFNYSIHLRFTKIPEYTAPVELYQTARTMGLNTTENKLYNLTWEFPVDSGFYYLVRLHFCEFQPEIFGESMRVFIIYIANQIAEKRADVFLWTEDGSGVPIYKDYVVYMGQGYGNKINLSIALQANPVDRKTVYNDALLNGLEIFKISSNDNNLAGPNPDPAPTSPSPPSIQSPTRRKINGTTIIGIVSGVVSGIVLISIVGFFIFRRGKKVKAGNFGDWSTWWGLSTLDATKSTKTPGSTTLPSDLCRYFSLAEIKAATNNFDNVLIIGVGGFGNVYKGYIDGWAEGHPVAIKRLKPGSQQGAHEFETEIEMLSQLRHVHLVSLIGYCNDGNEMILVYDYMARGTLRDHLYNNANNSPLSWIKRMEICIGAAHGLNYLHTGAKHMIIHRDVKTTNILLDEEWTAKVCDFGLSKLGPTSLSKAHVSTAVKGSFGYLDPEYYLRQQLSEKSDVYSFGVVLCEVLCAKPPITHTVTKESVNLVEWVKRCSCDGKLDEIVDPFLKGTIAIECLKKFVEIATNCLLDNGTERPSMNDVVWGLEFTLQLQENAGNEKVSSHQFEIEMMDAEKALIPKSIVDDSGDIFSSSDGQMSSTNSSSKVTITTKEDQSFASLDSDRLMSVGAVFSEISIPKGR